MTQSLGGRRASMHFFSAGELGNTVDRIGEQYKKCRAKESLETTAGNLWPPVEIQAQKLRVRAGKHSNSS